MGRNKHKVGPVALAMEQLMADPDVAEIADELWKRVPVGYADQLRAAATDAGRIATSVGAADPRSSGPSVVYTRDVPGWLRLGIATALTEWAAGESATCMHSPVAARPEPIVAAAWQPGLVVCGRCPHLLRTIKGTEFDRTCDGCGHLCDDEEPITPVIFNHGALTYFVGVCRECRFGTIPRE